MNHESDTKREGAVEGWLGVREGYVEGGQLATVLRTASTVCTVCTACTVPSLLRGERALRTGRQSLEPEVEAASVEGGAGHVPRQ